MKPPAVTNKDQIEIWWDEHIRTVTKIEKNRPDIIIWHSDKRRCQIVEITVPLDTHLKKAYKDKQEKLHTTHYQHAMCTQKTQI